MYQRETTTLLLRRMDTIRPPTFVLARRDSACARDVQEATKRIAVGYALRRVETAKAALGVAPQNPLNSRFVGQVGWESKLQPAVLETSSYCSSPFADAQESPSQVHSTLPTVRCRSLMVAQVGVEVAGQRAVAEGKCHNCWTSVERYTTVPRTCPLSGQCRRRLPALPQQETDQLHELAQMHGASRIGGGRRLWGAAE
jgi:hypothetical protein